VCRCLGSVIVVVVVGRIADRCINFSILSYVYLSRFPAHKDGKFIGAICVHIYEWGNRAKTYPPHAHLTLSRALFVFLVSSSSRKFCTSTPTPLCSLFADCIILHHTASCCISLHHIAPFIPHDWCICLVCGGPSAFATSGGYQGGRAEDAEDHQGDREQRLDCRCRARRKEGGDSLASLAEFCPKPCR